MRNNSCLYLEYPGELEEVPSLDPDRGPLRARPHLPRRVRVVAEHVVRDRLEEVPGEGGGKEVPQRGLGLARKLTKWSKGPSDQ